MAERNLFYEQLERQSSGDYVEVVRCKDCKHRFESLSIKAKDERKFQIGHYCKATGQIVNDDGFCAWAERRTDNA